MLKAHVRKSVGSIPTDCNIFSSSARGLVVMIVACQVMDPGSIPGERNFFKKSPRGLEPLSIAPLRQLYHLS
jgi:hypothetical protein